MKNSVGSAGLSVRILPLGEEGSAVAAAISGEILAAWQSRYALDIRVAGAVENRREAARLIRGWCDRDRVEVALTVGRCGHLAGDFAPELTAPLLHRALPGVEERICIAPPLRPVHLLYRGRAGMRGGALIVNLPADAARVRTIARFLAPVIGHAVEKARGSQRACARPRKGR